MASEHAKNDPPPSAVFRPAILIGLPVDLVEVVDRKEFLSRLAEKSLISDISCVQSLTKGVFRVNCKSAGCYNWLTTNGLTIRGQQCTLLETEPSFTFVRLFHCPFEVPIEVISTVFSKYGKVIKIKHEFDRDFPNVSTGTRSIKMHLKDPIPTRIYLKGSSCNVWYRGQPKACRICHDKNHEAPSCPFKGKCLRCHQSGHMSKDCANAWGARPVQTPTILEPSRQTNDLAVSIPNDESYTLEVVAESDTQTPTDQTSEQDDMLTSSKASTSTSAEDEANVDALLPLVDYTTTQEGTAGASTDPPQDTLISKDPRVLDDEGFVLIESRSSRRNRTRAPIRDPHSSVRYRSASCTRSSERSRSRSPMKSPKGSKAKAQAN